VSRPTEHAEARNDGQQKQRQARGDTKRQQPNSLLNILSVSLLACPDPPNKKAARLFLLGRKSQRNPFERDVRESLLNMGNGTPQVFLGQSDPLSNVRVPRELLCDPSWPGARSDQKAEEVF
jgi:hypothetical protein